MKLTRRLSCVALLGVLVLGLAACGGGDDPATPEDGAKTTKTSEKTVSEAQRANEPGPPADYVRSRCTKCSCRVYMGDGGYCTRPSCKHSWKDHQRPAQE